MKAKRSVEKGSISRKLLVLLFVGLFLLSIAPTASADTWHYRKTITIDHTKVDADLTDFPVLINLCSDDKLAAHAQDDGDDICFVNAANTIKFNHEIETFDGSTGELVAWVNVTSLSSTTDTTIYMYYGNADCGSQENPTGVWDSDFVMVQHLNETSGTQYDSTSNGKNGTPYFTPTTNQDATGQIDGADGFDGSDDCMVSSNLGFSVEDKTLSAWVKLNDVSQGGGGVVTLETDNGFTFDSIVYNEVGRGWGFGSSFWHRTDWSDVKETSTEVWVHVAATYTDYDYRLYRNGVQICSHNGDAAFPFPTNSRILVGKRHTGAGGNAYLDASIDEVRISNIVRGNQWINTSYTNQKDPSAFYSVGDQEGGPVQPVPELPTMILFSVGLLVLTGYVVLKRKNR